MDVLWRFILTRINWHLAPRVVQCPRCYKLHSFKAFKPRCLICVPSDCGKFNMRMFLRAQRGKSAFITTHEFVISSICCVEGCSLAEDVLLLRSGVY